MNYKLEDLIDIPLFQELLDRLNEALILPSAIIDNNSNILTATNWQDICTKFHRANPESKKKCKLSDQYILSHIEKGDFPVTYRCPHGLVDTATPIIIDGKHLGNFFIGQLFTEKPDMEFFREQARKYGFDEKSYLEAVSRVPVLTRDQLDKNLRFVKSLIEILAAIGLKHLKEIEARKIIKEKEERFKNIFEGSPDAIFIADPDTGLILDANSRASELLKRSHDEIKGMHQSELHPPRNETYSKQTFREHAEKTKQKKDITPFENTLLRSDGIEVPVEIMAQMVSINGKPVLQGVFRDITERKHVEDMLRKSKESFSKAEKIGHFGYWEWDIATNKLVWSDEVFRIYGLDPQKVIPTYETVVSTLSAETRDWFIRAVDDSLNNNAPFEGEYSILRQDGTVRYTHTIGNVIRDRDGKPISMFGVVQDITEHKQVEEELLKFKLGIDRSDEVVFITNIDGSIIYANPAFEKIYGYSIEESLGKTPNILKSGLLPSEAYKPLWDTLLAKKVVNGELINKTKDGRLLNIGGSANPILDDKGNIIGFLAIQRDITEAKNAEKEKERLIKAIDCSTDGISITDEEDRFIYLNAAHAMIYGYKQEELIGKTWREVTIPDMIAPTEKVLHDILHNKDIGTISGEFPGLRKDGTRIPTEVRATAFWDENGNYEGHICIIRDITELKRAEKELNKSHNLLDAINRAQSQFITDSDSGIIFEDLLRNLLTLTSSEYGLIGEVLHNPKGEPYLKIHAITNIAWNKEVKEFYKKNAPKGMEFHNLKTLFNAVITTGEPVISNDPSSDPRRGGLPEGHPLINSFLGLPFYRGGKLIGLVGIANRPGGYEVELVEYLKPILSTCANIIEAYRSDQKRKQSEEQIKDSLKEKEILLREIHHRVKNNMQIISSLLGLQAESIKEKRYLDMINDSRNRIMSMYMVHEKLYRSPDLEKIEFTKYISDLANGLLQSYGVKTSTVDLNINVNDTSLGIDFAIPCGLIINELVTNSLKYAFPDGRKGKINLSLQPLDENMFELVVSDNGAGIPRDVDFRKTESLGLRLVTILAENQLQGQVDLNRNGGTEFRIKFKGVK
jgi:PAS domain S-box-containing protein